MEDCHCGIIVFLLTKCKRPSHKYVQWLINKCKFTWSGFWYFLDLFGPIYADNFVVRFWRGNTSRELKANVGASLGSFWAIQDRTWIQDGSHLGTGTQLLDPVPSLFPDARQNRKDTIRSFHKLTLRFSLFGAVVYAVVRALVSHQCGLGSIPTLSVVCGLSLLVLYSAPRCFSPGLTPVFPSPQKPTYSWFAHS